jgi:hypothetical protein
MLSIGFSTGALFKEFIAKGVEFSRQLKLRSVELSALRLRELPDLIDFVNRHDLSAFSYVSLHAPTDFPPEQEANVARQLLAVALKRRWFVVVHPDCIGDVEAWKPFGEWLCIENMDKRKPVGRTVGELDAIFAVLPKARLCFDIAHARQVDTSMTEAYRILSRFRERICQVHMSEVTSTSKHDRISDAAVRSFREVVSLIPNVPIILESPVTPESAVSELEQASRVFVPAAVKTTV